MPPGVINFVPGDAGQISNLLLDRRDLGRRALHRQHRRLQRACGRRSARTSASYRSYPRIVGETGGKDFIVAHPSADPMALAVAIVRGGFEYQGQKCSAASRVYVPKSLWTDVRDRAVAMINEIKMGDVARLPQLHGRGDRQERVRRRSASTSRTRSRTRRSCRRQARRQRRATSSSRRWSRPTIPAIACCARRSSDRSSPRTSTDDASGRRR